jgi:TolB protein
MTPSRSIAQRSTVLACAAFALTVTAVALATPPGSNGRIAFKRYLGSGDSTAAIFTIDPSGRRSVQVTKPGPGVVDDQPDWAPDGSRLVFQRSGVPYAIYTVEPDGSGLKRFSPPCSATNVAAIETVCEDGAGASFLPDGKRIVYTRSTGKVREFPGYGDQIEHSDIVVRDVNGANLEVLIRSRPYTADLNYPNFSPDGSRLVYVRLNSPRSKPAGKHALFVARADGSGRRRITPWSLDAGDHPDWSPDGELIVFRSPSSGFEGSQVYLVRPDGTGLRQLTHFKPGTSVLSYSFSPDGKWITFAKSGRGGEPDIFVMRPDGKDIRPVTRTGAWDSAPDWGPTQR